MIASVFEASKLAKGLNGELHAMMPEAELIPCSMSFHSNGLFHL